MTIGTAGEMRMCNSTICFTDPEGRATRHAGRGGVGAVMGSKGVKAIVLDPADTPTMRKAQDPEAFKDACKRFAKGITSHPVTGQGLPAYGTNVLVNILNEAGGLPTYNFKEGRFAGAEKICAETMVEIQKKRGGNPTHGCHRGCIMKCSGICVDENGEYLSKQPEYETVWGHGANCGVDNLDDIIRMDYLEDDYGLTPLKPGASLGRADGSRGHSLGRLQGLHRDDPRDGQGHAAGAHPGRGHGHRGPLLRPGTRSRGQGPSHACL